MLVSTALKTSLLFKLSVAMGFISFLVHDSTVLQNLQSYLVGQAFKTVEKREIGKKFFKKNTKNCWKR